MEKIVCNGIRKRKKVEVVCTRKNHTGIWKVSVNGKPNEEAEAFIAVFTEKQIPFAGTYCPEDECSIYYAMSAIERYFDSGAKFTEVESDEQMPGELGVIY